MFDSVAAFDLVVLLAALTIPLILFELESKLPH
jgi:hypothetical protein